MNKKLKLLLFLFITLLVESCNTNYLEYKQHIKSPMDDSNYCLFLDGETVSSGPRGYYVLNLEKDIDPQKVQIDIDFLFSASEKDLEWIWSRQVLFNYEEGGFFESDPEIEILNNRQLVFSRGGYYFGLYDLISKDTISIVSPYQTWKEDIGYKKGSMEKTEKENAYGTWIKENLDGKIKTYIEEKSR